MNATPGVSFNISEICQIQDLKGNLKPVFFLAWTRSVFDVSKGKLLAIDGKTLRRSFNKAASKQAIHMISAWSKELGIVLGQTKVDDKSNEITAVPKLLDLMLFYK